MAIKKKELLTFATAWIDLKIIMLSEIRQPEKDKLSHLYLESNEQNRNRGMSTWARLTAVRGENGWGLGERIKKTHTHTHTHTNTYTDNSVGIARGKGGGSR